MDLVIGAGISGLSYAMFSGKQDYFIVEKDSTIGGYCRTTKRNGFVWDYSGHFFHFQDSRIKEMILGEMDESELVNVIKETKIKYKDLLVDYPFQKNIHQLSKEELIDCLYDLFTITKDTYDNFQEMLYCKFGKSISEKFLIPYNQKLYACDLKTLDKDAMGRFFPYADKEDIIRNFKGEKNGSYNGTFLYPKKGAFEYINAVTHHVSMDKVKCNTDIVHLDIESKKAYTSDGRVIKYDRIISTMPFPKLLEIAGVEYDKSIYVWNQVLCLNLGFNKKGKDIVDDWIYFPEDKYCFYRVGFYDNILAKKDKMSLYVELGFAKTDAVNPKEWLEPVLHDLKEAGIVSEDQTLIDHEEILMNPAYVHINSKSIEDVIAKKILLEKYDVYSIGRYGSWTYCSIEDNIKEARLLSEKLRQ